MNLSFEALCVLIWGLLWGSFLNVCILRIPQKKDIVKKSSACPQCDTPIQWYDNIPVLSFLLLKGRCRACHEKISWHYPMVELAAGLISLSLYFKFGLTWTTFLYWVLSMALIILIKIDIAHRILPDVITWPGVVLGLLLSITGFGIVNWLSSVLGFFIGFGFFYGIAVFYSWWKKKEGLGGGDIKLLGMLGAFLGVQSLPVIIVASSVIGILAGIPAILKPGKWLETALPFGPFLAVGAWIHIFWGNALLTWYLGQV